MPTPRKPTNLKLLDGETRPSRVGRPEPKPRPILPDPPPFLDATARRRWDELVPELEYCGVLTRIDGEVLAGYCMAYSDVCSLTAKLKKTGRTYKVGTNGALAARPEVAMLNRAWDDIRRFGAELGIGAAARTKVEVRKPDAGPSALEKVRQVTARR